MMSQLQFIGLLLIWFPSFLLIATLTWFEFLRVRFNFHIFFSLLFLLTFFFGFPLTILLVFHFKIPISPPPILMRTLLITTVFYAVYYATYKTRLCAIAFQPCQTVISMNRVETHLTWMILMSISMVSLAVFYIHNGFLLFKLHSYSQIFSSTVSNVALKRFFYFFIPSMVLVYSLRQDIKGWWFFLLSTVTFGFLTYGIVGGTRANIIVPFGIFLFIGIKHGWITLWMLIVLGVLGIVVMFWLALQRYGLSVSGGEEAFYSFLYLTRDTFSPWESLGTLLENYGKIEVQGLSPIVRDFYVFIPSWVWPARPSIILNTANYFTWEVLNNHSGLVISPTLIGSLLVMGGIWFILPGAVVVGMIIKSFDWLYMCGNKDPNHYNTAIIHSFCFSSMFNIIVLVREGLDSFISRIFFLIVIFGLCLFLAKILFSLLETVKLVHNNRQA